MSIYIERKIARKIYRAFKAAGNPIVNIWDHEQDNPIASEGEFMAVVFNLDECFMHPKNGGHIFFVNGNEWDAINNYTLGEVDETLVPVNEWVEKNS